MKTNDLNRLMRRIVLFCFSLAVPLAVSGQTITLDVHDESRQKVIMKIQQEYGYSVAFNSTDVDLDVPVSIDVRDEPVEKVMEMIFDGENVECRVSGKTIIVSRAGQQQPDTLVTVTGKIVDDKNVPVIGAAVMVKGDSSTGSISDLDGNYSISAPSGAVIVFTSLGYVSREVEVRGRTTINVTMPLDAEKLDEAIVVGYGTASKRLVSSSIASVKMDDIDAGAEIDPIKALQGRVTGISISSTSGRPGSAPNVIIRGVSSISGNSSPLYVVDGIPSETYPNINSADIESIEVLKDASATAIYGSRANSGVVIITTKSGYSGKTTVDVEGYYGFSHIAKDIPMANTAEYINVMQTAIDNYNVQMGAAETLYIPENIEEYDWIAGVSRKLALRGGASASLQGGNEKTKFYVSLGVEQQQGYLNKTSYNLYTGRAKFSHNIFKWLDINLNLAGSYARYNMVEETDGSLKILRAAREEQPWYSPYMDSESGYRVMTTNGLVRHNPVMMINEEDYWNDKYQIQGTLNFDVRIAKGLKWTPSISAYTTYDKTVKKLTENHTDRAFKDGWHALSEQKDNTLRYVIDNILSYEGKSGGFMYSAMIGHSFEKYESEPFGAASDNYANSAFPSSSFGLITSGNNIYPGNIGYDAYALESYFFRAMVNWKDRYIVNFSFRSDGSSRFPKNSRYGYFPAGSFAWIITNEEFMPKSDVLTELKLRLSAGQTGSMAGISNWAAMTLVSAGTPYNGESGMRLTQTAQNVEWEKSTKYNAGIDAELWSGRMTVNLDAYYSRTDDLLYNKPVVSTTGFTSMASNIGSLYNAGFELNLGGRVIDREFKWDLSANVSWSRNELTSLLDETDKIIVGTSTLYGGNKHALIIGQPISTWYMLRMDGIYQTDAEVPKKLYDKGVRAGDVRYHDLNGDGDVTDDDRMICGKATPDVFGGLNSTMTWKGLELNIFCQYAIGGQVFAGWKGCGQEGTEHLGLSSGTVTNDDGSTSLQFFNVSRDAALNYWKGPGTSNTIPRPLYSNNDVHTGWSPDYNILTSSRYLEDASYFKIKTITLGYNLPDKWMRKIGVDGIKVYFTVDNAFTFTRYSGYDPEVSISSAPASADYGYDFGYQPALRSFLFGVKFRF